MLLWGKMSSPCTVPANTVTSKLSCESGEAGEGWVVPGLRRARYQVRWFLRVWGQKRS